MLYAPKQKHFNEKRLHEHLKPVYEALTGIKYGLNVKIYKHSESPD